MIAFVFTMRTQDGTGPELEAAFGELAAKVRANERGALLYQLTKSRTQPNTYKVLEMYQDDEALAAHFGSDYMRELGPKLAACFDGEPDVERLDPV